MKLLTQYLVNTNADDVRKMYRDKIAEIFRAWNGKTAAGAEQWTGWLNWVSKDHEATIAQMETLREKWIKLGVKTVVVLGIGGSYMGARAGVEFNNGQFSKQKLQIVFVPSFSSRYLNHLVKKVEQEKFALVVISKSGTTLEVSVTFRIFRELLKKKEPKYYELIATVTDKIKGVLRNITDLNHYVNFVIEDDIGGRYSTLTAVGLLPNVLAGVDVRQFFVGAKDAQKEFYHGDIYHNHAAFYASLRHYFYTMKKYKIECLCSYEPDFTFMIEQAKQLFAESEGKNNKGLMPIRMNFTTDLHSVGQLLQDGEKNFFETIFTFKHPDDQLKVPTSSFNDDDQLNWLTNQSVFHINEQVCLGTLGAHTEEGKVDNLVFELTDWSPATFGYFYHFLCIVASFSAYLLEVNPYDQPGVEAYKKRMFHLLGKK